MQIDGYSLDAQQSRMKAFCEFNDYEIAGEYEDAGKSGKSIEGRVAFNNMMEDIKSGKDDVSFVLVFKLSRFDRSAADVLNSLQIMQDFKPLEFERFRGEAGLHAFTMSPSKWIEGVNAI